MNFAILLHKSIDCFTLLTKGGCNSDKTKIAWILPFCSIKVLTIGISRNQLPVFKNVLSIPIQYCNINNPGSSRQLCCHDLPAELYNELRRRISLYIPPVYQSVSIIRPFVHCHHAYGHVYPTVDDDVTLLSDRRTDVCDDIIWLDHVTRCCHHSARIHYHSRRRPQLPAGHVTKRLFISPTTFSRYSFVFAARRCVGSAQFRPSSVRLL